ncbi:MAG: hypothetical protein CVU55_13420 [Deltaproteobacteria bacterium HGW-Deltaproteobacteria-13]|jgi:4-amino-4-deoxy-L-arabinose transferase-like glycosyltransferase|nr:MAG: hypothetical protein CVU55_13420 [Deltaproteobacteria bacterium HGW-Deltaproteobacteria-13]
MIYNKDDKSIIAPLLILVLSAFLIRFFAFTNTLMINNDGPVYIHQARALWHGLGQAINTCSMDYPTLYTILIAAAYPVTGDWVYGAMAVNLIFGTLMIIPLYLFLRRFLDEKTNFLTTFIFVMLPLFVIQSVNIIRDPSYWFFSILGLYFLVYDDKSKTPFVLILSSLSFLVATATRVEGIIFIMGGCIYTLMVFKGRRLKAIALFLAPVILAIACFVVVQLIRHPENFYWYRFQEIPLAIINAFKQYQNIETIMTSFISHAPPGGVREFMINSRTLIWFIAMGVIFLSALEALFYFFFLLLLSGLAGLRDRMRKDSRIFPLIMIAVISLIVLYCYCLSTWSMENRRLAMVILPLTVIIGFGVENLIRWLHNKFGLSNFTSIVLLCILVLILTLPKNLRTQEADKLVYKDIGETIARVDGGSGEIELITLGSAGRWIDYYANLHVAGAPCPNKYTNWRRDKSIIAGSYEDFIHNMKMRKIRYIIWEENNWPGDQFDFLKAVRTDDLKELKEWTHHDTGRIILYRVLY